MSDDDSPWVHCPSQGLKPIPMTDWDESGCRRVACPLCWFSYSTMMNDPLLPSHWVSTESGDVMVVGP